MLDRRTGGFISCQRGKWTQRLCQHVGLVALSTLFLLLAVGYSIANPIFEAPDEIWHYLYARHIAEGRGLPVQPEVRDGDVFAQQEASQPPLYYLVAGAAIRWISFGDPETFIRPNAHASIGAPDSEDNKNRFVHNPALEAFPYSSDVLAVHIVRLLSTLLGLGAVVLTYAIALETWGRRKHVALGAAATVAFTPQFIYISGAASNDSAVACFSALTIWMIVRAGRHGCSLRDASAMGIAAGLAALSKLSGFGLAPLVSGAAFWLSYQRRGVKAGLLTGATVAVTFCITTSWWLARNLALYGELLPLKTFLRREELVNQWPSLEDLWRDLPGLSKSFWGLFGWFNIVADSGFYWFFQALTMLAAVGLVIVIRGHRNWPTGAAWGLFWVASWLLVTIAGMLRYHLLVQAFQGRLLFPAVSAIALLLYLGLQAFVPQRLSMAVAYGLGAALLTVAAVVPVVYIMPAYARPGANPRNNDVAYVQEPMARFGDAFELLAAKLSTTTLHPGEDLEVVSYWRANRSSAEDYSLFIHLLDWQGRTVAQKDTFPGGGAYATSLWHPGDVIRDVYRVKVPSSLPSPSIVQVETGLYLAKDMVRLPVHSDSAPIRGSAILLPQRIRVMPFLSASSCSGEVVDVGLGGLAVLRRYTLESLSVRQDEKLSGALCWEAQTTVDRDYTVFVQLVGRSGLVAQDDAQPRRGAFPTSAWHPGDLVVHPFSIPILPHITPGRYQLIAGLYDLPSGRRLQAQGVDFVGLTLVDVLP